jgi:peptidoglycan L-alanyl-D-glutamate endopeptidase CwlK
MTPHESAILGQLYLPFADKLRLLAQRCVGMGLPIRYTIGMRTFAEQAIEYAKGRNAVGEIIDAKAKTTDAKPGMSWHQYGLAVDFCLVKPGGDVTWSMTLDLNNDHIPDFAQIGAAAELLGLDWGGSWAHWQDWDHLDFSGGLSIPKAQALYATGGVEAVWHALAA